MIAVSECLRGTPCRYDGMTKPNKGARELVKAGAVCICPEVLGGLDTPRSPAEIQGGDGFDVLCGKAKVVNKAGEDVTAQYVKGAEIVLELCKKYGVTEAVLKEKSPSCGSSLIYDGSFTGTLRPGVGVTAALLLRNGITVRDEQSCAEKGNKAK